jgi:hypothetical protein
VKVADDLDQKDEPPAATEERGIDERAVKYELTPPVTPVVAAREKKNKRVVRRVHFEAHVRELTDGSTVRSTDLSGDAKVSLSSL